MLVQINGEASPLTISRKLDHLNWRKEVDVKLAKELVDYKLVFEQPELGQLNVDVSSTTL